MNTSAVSKIIFEDDSYWKKVSVKVQVIVAHLRMVCSVNIKTSITKCEQISHKLDVEGEVKLSMYGFV